MTLSSQRSRKALRKNQALGSKKSGSLDHARGDHSVDSDYDVVVVADGDEEELHNLVTEKSYAIMCAYDALVGALEYDPFIWAREKKTSLGRNILREGIKLYGT